MLCTTLTSATLPAPWQTVQLSAVRMIGTPGQGATDGIRFIQLYFGLPIAMVILGVTLVPLLHGSGVYTAYEYLERRFDARTRSLTAFLFLLSRGMSCGTILAAPAVVFSAVFGWPLTWSVALIGIPTVIYTMLGGVQAVAKSLSGGSGKCFYWYFCELACESGDRRAINSATQGNTNRHI